ncbi:tyrosine-type recombinase/integrase [Brevibacillus sp. SYSU BS000544]|uniref:tyrosine-type recombinase/integrase n=1 Tax=Brevibacillus sp. SYSU BS000544 TaxID=3416443 RepID=UPI003CE506B3
MSLDIFSKYNYEEICAELGILLDDLFSLVNNKKKSETTPQTDEHTILKIIEHFKKMIINQRDSGRKSEQTIRYYLNFLNRFQRFISKNEPDLKVNMLNERLFDQFILGCNGRKNTTLSPGTLNTYISILRKLLSFALNEGYINKDLRYRFQRHSVKLLPRYFQEKQIKKILDYTKHKTHAYLWISIIWFLLGTGCRVSELVSIRVKDFDFESNLLYVKGKGKKERYVPIYPHVKEVIKEYLFLSGVKEWNKNITGYLFARDHGMIREKKVSIRSVQYQIHDIVKNLKLDDHLNVHSFRHTFAVNCLRAGMRIEYLSQILGHENPETTYIYIQMLPIDLKREVMEKFPFPLEKLLIQLYGIGENEHGHNPD